MKQVEKIVGTLNLLRFVNYGDFNLSEGYKKLQNELKDDQKLDWLSFHRVIFTPPVPLSMKLYKQKYKMLNDTEHLFQTRRYNYACNTDAAQQRY